MSGTEAWTVRPTSLERRIGRLLRSPEEHVEEKTEETVVEKSDDKTLVNEGEKTEEKVEEKTEEKVEEKVEKKLEPLTVESLTIPEGFEVEPELAKDFLEILNGDMQPKDRANALLALHGKTISTALEADSKLWDDMQTEWKDEVKADPDIGGAKLQPTLANVGKLLSEFGTDELKGVFDSTGAGNNVHMIKFLNVIADKLTEGKFFKAGSPSGQDDPNAAAARLFPSMKG